MSIDDKEIVTDTTAAGLSAWMLAGTLAFNPLILVGGAVLVTAAGMKGLQAWRRQLNRDEFRSLLKDSCE